MVVFKCQFFSLLLFWWDTWLKYGTVQCVDPLMFVLCCLEEYKVVEYLTEKSCGLTDKIDQLV